MIGSKFRTAIGDFNVPCADCGVPKSQRKEWGILVPRNVIAFFCHNCWHWRWIDYKTGELPRPLGTLWKVTRVSKKGLIA